MATIEVSRGSKVIKAIIAACYPDWKGRKVRVSIAAEYQIADYWSEGSRRFVLAYDLGTGAVATATKAAGIPYLAQAHARFAIPQGIALVEHGIFCGKDIGVTIFISAVETSRILTNAEMAQLSAGERRAGERRATAESACLTKAP